MAPPERWTKGPIVESLERYLSVPANFQKLLDDLNRGTYLENRPSRWETEVLCDTEHNQDDFDHLQKDTFGAGPRPFTTTAEKAAAILRGKQRRKDYGATLLHALNLAQGQAPDRS